MSGLNALMLGVRYVVRIYAAADALADAIGYEFEPGRRANTTGLLPPAHRPWPTATLEGVWAEGRRMRLEQAVAHVLNSPAEGGQAAGAVGAAGGPSQPLSPREQQVVHLVARGLSDLEIGQASGLSKRTVETHAAHICREAGSSLAGPGRYLGDGAGFFRRKVNPLDDEQMCATNPMSGWRAQ